MLWYFLSLGLSQASEDATAPLSMRIEHLALPEDLSGLNSTLSPWMPWLVYTNPEWAFKGSIFANAQTQQSNTSETVEQTIISETLIAVEAERIIASKNFDWNIGFGVHSNLPLVKQYSSQFTDSEQDDVDTQTQNQQAELSFTRLRIPCTVQVPIHKHLQVGLGVQTSYTIQRSQSDFTTYFNTAWYTSPILTLQTR